MTAHWQIILGPILIRSYCSRSAGCSASSSARGRMAETRWRSAASASASAACSRAIGSTSTSRRARRTRSSAPTAREKPRSSASSRADLRPELRIDPLRRPGRHAALTPPHRARRGLARSFQVTSIFRDFSALDNVALAGRPAAATASGSGGRRARSPALREPARAASSRSGSARAPTARGQSGPRRAAPARDRHGARGRKRALLLASTSRWPAWGSTSRRRWSASSARSKRRITIRARRHDNGRRLHAWPKRILRWMSMAGSSPPERRRRFAATGRAPSLSGRGPGVMLAVDSIETAYGGESGPVRRESRRGLRNRCDLLAGNGMARRPRSGRSWHRRRKAGTISFGGARDPRAAPVRVAQAGLGLRPEGRQCFRT